MSSTSTEHSNWTAAGSDVAAQNTYTSIKRALADLIESRNVEVFLQGSYANHTNIRADSDVDVVVMTKRSFFASTERLSARGKVEWDLLPPATYTSMDLRQEVEAALSEYYGSTRVHQKNKCIRVDKSEGYVDADVVPCVEYRWFESPSSTVWSPHVEGIRINPLRGQPIVNFPKAHIRNGERKNAACAERYKKTVRQIKRLRNRAIDQGYLPEGLAPGYLLECMTFNTPPEKFVYDDSDRLSNVLLWLKYANKSDFWSCDRVHKLFTTDPGQFQVTTAQQILDALWEAY